MMMPRIHGLTTLSAKYFLTRQINSLDFSTLKKPLKKIVIDVHRAHFWDITGVAALDKVVIKLRREGADVSIIGLNEASETLLDKFAVHDKPEEVEKMMGEH